MCMREYGCVRVSEDARAEWDAPGGQQGAHTGSPGLRAPTWQKTRMPVGLWNRSTAVSTLFTFWPPAPLARAVLSSMSCAGGVVRGGRAGGRASLGCGRGGRRAGRRVVACVRACAAVHGQAGRGPHCVPSHPAHIHPLHQPRSSHPPLPATSHPSHLGLDLHIHLIHLGHDGHCGGGGVHPPRGLGGGHALHAVHARLVLEARVHPAHARTGGLDFR